MDPEYAFARSIRDPGYAFTRPVRNPGYDFARYIRNIRDTTNEKLGNDC